MEKSGLSGGGGCLVGGEVVGRQGGIGSPARLYRARDHGQGRARRHHSAAVPRALYPRANKTAYLLYKTLFYFSIMPFRYDK